MLNSAHPSDVTQILQAWSDGDQSTPERLVPLVYQELRRVAGEYLRQERPDPNPSGHEAYLKLVDQPRVDWKNRRAHRCRRARVHRQPRPLSMQ